MGTICLEAFIESGVLQKSKICSQYFCEAEIIGITIERGL